MNTNRYRGGRKSSLPALLLVGALALSGCSSNESDGDQVADSAESSLLPPAEGTTQYPLTLETQFGETVLEERPERIAVIGFSPNLDALEALDVVPIFSQAEETQWPWRDQQWSSRIETVDTGTRSEPTNYEALAASDPDLIIATNFVWEEADYQRLSDIAPVLEYKEEVDTALVSWQDTQRLIGETLDLSAAADETVGQAEQAIADVAAAHPEFEGKTITLAMDYEPQWGLSYYTLAGSTAEGVMADLGFTPNPLAEQVDPSGDIADEQVGLLDADVLVMIYNDEELREKRESQELFRALPPVRDGRYVSLVYDGDDTLVTADGRETPNVTWVMRRGASALSLPYTVDVIANQWFTDIDLN